MSTQHGALRDAFLDELKDSYDSENQLVKALPKLAKVATSEQLSRAFTDHLSETRQHVTRLERVFDLLGEKPTGKHCQGIAGIIEEGGGIIKKEKKFEAATMDARLVAAGQRAEHYEIAAYGTLIAWAKQLGLSDAESILQETLNEEKAADKTLTSLAEGGINLAAMNGVMAEATVTGTSADHDEDTDTDEEESGSTKNKSANGRKSTGRSRGR